MGATDYTIGAGWAVVAVLVAGGFYMMGPSPEDFMIARYCLVGAGVIFGATGILWGFTTESALVPRIVVVGLMAAITGVGINEGLRLVASRSHPNPPPSDIARHTLDRTVLLDCRWSQLPTEVPPYGLFEQQIATPDFVGGVISSAQQPGTKIDWSKNPPSFAYACRFSNFGTAPVLNVETDLTVQFLEVIKTDTGTKSGKILHTKIMRTPRTNLGIGDKNIFEFYLRNRSEYWIQILLPSVVSVQAVGDDKQQTVQLVVPSGFSGISLPPFSVTASTSP